MESNDQEKPKKKRGRPSKGDLAVPPSIRSYRYRQRRKDASMEKEGERLDFLRLASELVRRVALAGNLPSIQPALEEYPFLLGEVRTVLNSGQSVVWRLNDINAMLDDIKSRKKDHRSE